MEIFAVITLIIVIIAVTHVHNWVTRKIFEDEDNGNVMAFLCVSLFYVVGMIHAFKYLILWAYPLIK